MKYPKALVVKLPNDNTLTIELSDVTYNAELDIFKGTIKMSGCLIRQADYNLLVDVMEIKTEER